MAGSAASTGIPTAPELQDAINRRVYQRAGATGVYWHRTLLAMEITALLGHQPAVYGKDVLDVGVGTGRTSRFLAPLARRYLGIDYSQPMLQAARARCPGVDFQLLDMLEVATLGACRFDFVFAPSNVIDSTSQAGRDRVLAGVAQVLRPGGLFTFSSHNLACAVAQDGPRLQGSRNPVRLARNLQQYARQMRNHRKLRRFRRIEGAHAILNDAGHDFSVLHYYLDRFECQRQLRAAGFRLLVVIDDLGSQLTDECIGAHSNSLMYVARRDDCRTTAAIN